MSNQPDEIELYSWEKCPTCGKLDIVIKDYPPAKDAQQAVCSECGGNGGDTFGDNFCPKCKGNGWENASDQYSLLTDVLEEYIKTGYFPGDVDIYLLIEELRKIEISQRDRESKKV